ncbi:class I SAM-dependent methyltransferase [Nocardia sp. CDC160]|uniref:class I SAM-dependent methyltransferase n=1 Tax=Nocardia sp. CDC160 TaxID=3112166 RepID=UPI002DBBFF16|nr:class I SAM-dependent methyltransferase [Nocardia sp. CDC160]MEC3917664.1 class I SAM-dependent methyltransferase [Nocardia sp. CDC160]
MATPEVPQVRQRQLSAARQRYVEDRSADAMSASRASGVAGIGVRCERARRRLLSAARQRYAEDRLAEAVSAGARQVVVFGGALDTFASHNPYRDVPVFRLADSDIETIDAAAGFDRRLPTFAVHLGGADRALDAGLQVLQRCSGGVEIVFDVAAERATCVIGLLCDTGWAVLEVLDPAGLACRYLDDAPGPTDSTEPRLVWARVGNNAGRLPN